MSLATSSAKLYTFTSQELEERFGIIIPEYLHVRGVFGMTYDRITGISITIPESAQITVDKVAKVWGAYLLAQKQFRNEWQKLERHLGNGSKDPWVNIYDLDTFPNMVGMIYGGKNGELQIKSFKHSLNDLKEKARDYNEEVLQKDIRVFFIGAVPNEVPSARL